LEVKTTRSGSEVWKEAVVSMILSQCPWRDWRKA